MDLPLTCPNAVSVAGKSLRRCCAQQSHLCSTSASATGTIRFCDRILFGSVLFESFDFACAPLTGSQPDSQVCALVHRHDEPSRSDRAPQVVAADYGLSLARYLAAALVELSLGAGGNETGTSMPFASLPARACRLASLTPMSESGRLTTDSDHLFVCLSVAARSCELGSLALSSTDKTRRGKTFYSFARSAASTRRR